MYVTDRDSYGRLVAVLVRQDGKNITHEMVKRGMAWWYEKYAPDDRVLERLEIGARAARRGLWSDPYPMPPWEWRALRRGR